MLLAPWSLLTFHLPFICFLLHASCYLLLAFCYLLLASFCCYMLNKIEIYLLLLDIYLNWHTLYNQIDTLWSEQIAKIKLKRWGCQDQVAKINLIGSNWMYDQLSDENHLIVFTCYWLLATCYSLLQLVICYLFLFYLIKFICLISINWYAWFYQVDLSDPLHQL